VVDAAGASDVVPLLVTIGADRPPGARGFEDVVSRPRSVQRIEPRSAGDLAVVGYTSGTTGLPKGAMISQGALTACVRLMPSMFRISPYGRCAFAGVLGRACRGGPVDVHVRADAAAHRGRRDRARQDADRRVQAAAAGALRGGAAA
jgi:non-ribosomal peptide synthetase component F